MEEENINQFIVVMKRNGYQPVLPVNPDVLKNKNTINQWKKEHKLMVFSFQKNEGDYPLTVDVLLSDKVDVHQAFKRSVIRPLGSINIRVASIEDLITLKENTGRKQDLSDMEHLKRILKVQQDANAKLR